jgi:hypothetical protein
MHQMTCIFTTSTVFCEINCVIDSFAAWSRVLERLIVLHVVKKFPHFVKPKELPNCCIFLVRVKLTQSVPHILLFLRSRSSKWILSCRFPHQNPVFISLFSHVCHHTCIRKLKCETEVVNSNQSINAGVPQLGWQPEF